MITKDEVELIREGTSFKSKKERTDFIQEGVKKADALRAEYDNVTLTLRTAEATDLVSYSIYASHNASTSTGFLDEIL